MSRPDGVPDRCVSNWNESKPTVKANGRKAVFLNPERVQIAFVDLDCWLGNDTLKADYVAVKPEVVDVIVELEGKDIPHGVEQILATSRKWRKPAARLERVGGLVVFSRSPQGSAELTDFKTRLLRDHNIWLELDKDGKTEYRFETFLGK